MTREEFILEAALRALASLGGTDEEVVRRAAARARALSAELGDLIASDQRAIDAAVRAARIVEIDACIGLVVESSDRRHGPGESQRAVARFAINRMRERRDALERGEESP